ncbi:hypothetical protein ACIBH1_27315 [Nonomuraea sp. NPDC050663]|uniref:hypothetical protein n=1 Tax=Nonomuraea sp. NPDC050663 TaxID=3364370 RepID=UPI00379FF9A1
MLFVCPHGAGKSRIAAAWFAGAAPAGWGASTAGLDPQDRVSVHAPRLLAGSPVERLLDHELPRPLSAAPEPSMVVTIDCPSGVIPGAVEWRLEHGDFDQAMADELRVRVLRLTKELAL